MEKQDKIIIAVLFVVVVGLYFITRHSSGSNTVSGASIADIVAPSTNVPWYLSYNNSPAFSYQPNTQQVIPLALPNNSAGQANSANDDCQICSLFPNFASVQL